MDDTALDFCLRIDCLEAHLYLHRRKGHPLLRDSSDC